MKLFQETKDPDPEEQIVFNSGSCTLKFGAKPETDYFANIQNVFQCFQEVINEFFVLHGEEVSSYDILDGPTQRFLQSLLKA